MARETGRAGPVGARPIGEPPRKKSLAGRLGLLALLILAVIAALLMLSRCGNDGATSVAVAAPTTSATSSITSVSPTNSATSPSAAAQGGGIENGTITAGGQALFPYASIDAFAAFTGQEATSTAVAVESVPADEGFWVGSGPQNRVWVQLSGAAGESPFTVKAGDHVAFTGTVTPNASGFATSVGVTAKEGADLLQAQGQHIAVPRSALKLTP